MASTEAKIITNFLIPPAPLPAIISLKEFTALFPRNQQSSSQIRVIYRDIQHTRARLIDAVGRNIDTEVKKGNAQRREVMRSRRSDGIVIDDDEAVIETTLFGPTSNLPNPHPHTIKSIVPEIDTAIEDIEEEVRKLEEEAETLMVETNNTVGGLSDLRYGRLANSQLRTQVLDGLERLEASCEEK